jgi:outer membrane biosynthesis protein TonB
MSPQAQDLPFAASTDQRLLERADAAPASDRRRVGLIVLACLLAHAAVLSLFVRFDRPVRLAPTEEDSAVEVIVEPPAKPQEPTPAPESKEREKPAKQAVLDEKEATDAPRASEEKSEKDVRTEAPHAAKAAAKAERAEAAPKPVERQQTSAAAPAALQPKNDQADGDPRPDAPEKPQAQKDAPNPEKPPEPPTPSFASDDPVAAALRYAPVGGGNAEATYLSTVYGMVAPRLDLHKLIAGRPHTSGEIVFAIDYGGAFAGGKVTKSTGLRDVDAAAMAALRAAGPFPLPPTGGGLTLSFKFAGQ